MNFGFDQALSLVYNWFNPDWYDKKSKKKRFIASLEKKEKE